MTMRLSTLAGAVAVAAWGAGPSVASVDTSPGPGGVYRLKPGIYVQAGTDCGSPPNAAIRRYDGRGISGAHTRACRARVLSRKGSRYAVDQSCIDAGAGPAPRVSERQIVTVTDALTFTLRTTGSGATFRYCPITMLPAGLRSPLLRSPVR